LPNQSFDVVGDKVGTSTADKIARWIVSEGWPVGMSLGTETELMNRFVVSRGVFREAVRILEQQGVVEMRRGRGGGLRVSAPNDGGIVQAATRYLTFRRVRPEQQLEARIVIELSLLPLIIDRMNNENERTLRAALTDECLDLTHPGPPPTSHHYRGFHTVLASLAGNPTLELYAHVLVSLVAESYFKGITDVERRRDLVDLHDRHTLVAEAILDRDVERASRELERDLTHTLGFFAGAPERGLRK
jgi:DNA-binding FadR family transcriptional regulator